MPECFGLNEVPQLLSGCPFLLLHLQFLLCSGNSFYSWVAVSDRRIKFYGIGPRPKKSPFHSYVAPYADPAQTSGSIANFYPNQPTSHLLIEDNPNYSRPKSEAARPEQHDSANFLGKI